MAKELNGLSRDRAIGFAGIAHRSSWPKADSGNCCIFEAINLVGVAQFGPDWTGNELLAHYWNGEPKVIEAQRLAHSALPRRIHRAPPPISISNYSSGKPSSSLEAPDLDFNAHAIKYQLQKAAIAHSQAVEQQQELWNADRLALDRLQSAVEWIAQKCRDGMIVAYTRFTTGGALMPMPASEWNAENPVRKFVSGGGFEQWFFTVSPARSWPVYIFIDRKTLGEVLAALKYVPATVSSADLGQLSPYLQLAVKLALKNNYQSREQCETKPIREAEVRKAWPDALPGIPMTKSGVTMIASVVGFPDPTAIVRGTSGGARRKSGLPRKT